jgi:hypothetical protein
MLQAEQSGVQVLAGAKICLCSPFVTMLEAEQSRVQFLAGRRDFPYLKNVQTGFGTHSASYSMATMGCFPGTKLSEHKIDLALR